MTSSLLHSFTVGILGVDEEELGDLISHLQLQNSDGINYGMRKEYVGTLWGIHTVLYITNVGKAAAASATTDMILRHNVSCIFFLGTAGAYSSVLHPGDIVIGNQFVNYDSTPPYENSIQAHEGICKIAQEASLAFLKSFDPFAKVYKGLIGTGDCYMISRQKLNEIISIIPETLCIEMEGSACAQVAASFDVPFTAIRTISNYIKISDEKSSPNKAIIYEYSTFLEKVQRFYTLGIVKEIYHSIDLEELAASHTFKENKKVGVVFDDKKLCKKFESLLLAEDTVCIHTKPGKAFAASAATQLIVKYGIKELIVISSAFSLNDKLKEEDVVLSSASFQYDVDVRPFRPLFQIPYLGITEFDSIPLCITPFLEQNQYVIGKVASGDSFENAQIAKLQDVLCIDSITAPCAQIAYQYNIKFASIHVMANPIR